jgi:uncharacterized BrkB/YihY/UPF0761 family membrane protein
MKLAEVALLLTGAHLAAVYYGIYVARLSYAGLLTLTASVTVIFAILTRLLEPEWRPRLAAIIQEDGRDKTLLLDGLGFIAVYAMGAAIGAWMMVREYGVGGWFGVWSASTAVNAII